MPTLQTVLLVGPILLFSMVAHEIAHGYAALRQGDRTALDAGRLSWNPARHIDPLFTIVLPLMMLVGSSGRFAIGGARPVPVNPDNFRHRRRGDVVVSLAGVFANLLVALGCVGLMALIGMAGRQAESPWLTLGILQAMCWYGILLNAVLIAFNLLPIPPLDGSHVFRYLLPRPLAAAYGRFGRYGIVVLFAMMAFFPEALRIWMAPAVAAAGAARRSLVERGLVLPIAAPWLR